MTAPEKHGRTAIPWLLFGGFLFGWGWLVGVFLLWRSRAWTLSEKLLGTFVIPGGLAASVVVALVLLAGRSETGPCAAPTHSRTTCVGVTTSAGPGAMNILGSIVIVMAPMIAATYLARRRRSGSPAGLVHKRA